MELHSWWNDMNVSTVDHIKNNPVFLADFIESKKSSKEKENKLKIEENLEKEKDNKEAEESINQLNWIESNKEWISDTKEFINTTINEVLDKYLKKINSKEWITLSADSIYTDVLNILDWLSNKIDKNNIFANDINIIKENFLLPKSKWVELINFIISEKFSNNYEKEWLEIDKWNINMLFSILESSLWTLYDIWTTKSEQELKQYINEVNLNPEFKDLFNDFPDLEKIIINVIPSFIKTISKDKFNSSIAIFLDSIKWDILTYSKYISSKEYISDTIKNKSKLNIINNFSKFLWSVINKDNIDSFSKNLATLEFISKNEKITEILNIINWKSISKDQKFLLSNKILEWIELFSRTEILDKDINEFINSLILLISKIAKNIPSDQLNKLINNFKWWTGETSGFDIDNISLRELNTFLWKNKDNLIWIWLDLLNKWYDGEIVSINDLIVELFKNDLIAKNLDTLWNKLVENLKKIAKIDLTTYARDFRKELLKYNFKWWDIDFKREIKLTKLEWDLIEKLWWKINWSIFNLISLKITSKENNNLQKDEIIWIVLTELKSFLIENDKLVFEYAKTLGFNVEWSNDQKNILNLINKILENPKLVNIISTVISNISKNVEWKSDIIWELKNVVKESINDNWKNILNWTEKDITNIWINTFYNEILWNPRNIKTILELLPNEFKVNDKITDKWLLKLWPILKKHLDNNDVHKLIKWIDLNNSINIEETISKIYNSINNKTWFIDDLIDSNIINEISSNNESRDITHSQIDKWIDYLYKTLKWSNDKDMTNTLNKIIWLSEISNITVLWKNLWENLVAFLNSINKNKFKNILGKNNLNINKLINWELNEKEKIVFYWKLSMDIIKVIDINKIKSYFENTNLDDNMKIAIDLSDEFQEVIKDKSDLVEWLITKWTDINDIYNWKIEVDLDSIQVEEQIKWYWEEVFELLHNVILKIDKKYLEDNLSTWDWDWNWKDNEIVDMFVGSFLSENKWFLVKEWISWIFEWFDYSAWKSLDSYFRNKEGNKENFWDTLFDFLKTNKENKIKKES